MVNIDLFLVDNIRNIILKNVKNKYFIKMFNTSFYLFGFLKRLFNYINFDSYSLTSIKNNTLTSKSLSIEYKGNKIVLLTYLLDETNTVKYVIKGVNYESMDGEYRPSFTTYDALKTFESKNFIYFQAFYTELVKHNFFNEIKVFYDDKESTTTQDYNRAASIILVEYTNYMRLGYDSLNSLNKHFTSFLLSYERVISNILIDNLNKYPDKYREYILNVIGDFLNQNGKIKNMSKLNVEFSSKINFQYFKSRFRLVSKVIPINISETFIRELQISSSVSQLKLNNVTNCVPLLFSFLNLKDYKYSNINILKNINNTEVLHNLHKKTYDHYFDGEDMDDHINDSYDLISKIKQLQKVDYVNNKDILLIMEYVGRPLGSLPYDYKKIIKDGHILEKKDVEKNKMEQLYEKIMKVKNTVPVPLQSFYYNVYTENFNWVLFEVVYTLLCLNKRLKLIHNDLHLNNITYIISLPYNYTVFSNREEIYKKKNIENNI